MRTPGTLLSEAVRVRGEGARLFDCWEMEKIGKMEGSGDG